jgi:hypothetical protein
MFQHYASMEAVYFQQKFYFEFWIFIFSQANNVWYSALL